MCESRKLSTLSHIASMIHEGDEHGLKLYRDLISGNKEVIAEINSGLSANPETRALIQAKAPEFIGLR
jgi:hypothetical protein